MPNPLEHNSETDSAAGGSPSVGQSLLNEWHAFSHGLADTPGAIKDAAVNAWDHKGASLFQVGVSVAAGLGIGLLSREAGPLGLAVRGLGAALGASFIYDGIRPWQDTFSQAWDAKNQAQLDRASKSFAHQFGQFTFDAAIMTPGAMAGTFAGARLSMPALKDVRVSAPEILKGSSGKAMTEAGESSAQAAADAAPPPEVVPEAPARPQQARYRYVQLNPSPEASNPRFDFGVEVTEPRLLNGQPNLDHHGSRTAADMPSAAEQALVLPADQLPAHRATLATINPDLDSVTAMAVLANRFEGRAVNEVIVREIGRLDRGLPPTELSADPSLKDQINAMRRKVRERDDLHWKVFFAQRVLDGSAKIEDVQRMAYEQRSINRDIRARLDREVKPEVVVPGKLAFVQSDNRMAISYGYRHAPVVVLQQETPRFSRFSVGAEDGNPAGRYLGRALRELRSIEPGWGGRPTIFGSPQDRNTELSPQQVLDVVKKYVDPPAYKRYLWNISDYLTERRPFKWFVSQH